MGTHANGSGWDDPEGMSRRPVIVYPPDEDAGRRVGIDGVIGRALHLRDVLMFMRRAGLPDWDQIDVATSDLIEWRGGGPEAWARCRGPFPPTPR